MGSAETKEAPRTVSFENQIVLTEAALQQLQSSVAKAVPQSTKTNSNNDQPTKTTNTNPLPSIETSGTVGTWRALASSVNDRELQRLRDEYKQKLVEQEKVNREKFNLTKENFSAELERVEKKFSKFIYTPICELERADIEKCYLENPKEVLKCSSLADKFMKCVQQHREQALRMPQSQVFAEQTNKN